MDIFNILQLFGGLAIFLYGMNVMGEALEKQSGGRLKGILEKLTSNPIKGVILGAAVTAVIQSSSATTVMVVGFVNSGIMSLAQSIGIIMGANIGTTVTAWLLSLTGIEGGNFFINLLKPSSFSPILAVIGIIFTMFSKSARKKDIGTILLGFAVLMFGMDTMSAAVKPLADVPEFTNILTLFSNPVLGVLTGMILTAIIQSSSASVGILQALSVTGSITFSAAIPIITGQNIGTCITALLSSIGANKNARRAAVVHLCFNIIGTIVFLAVFYILKAFINMEFVNEATNPATIAIVHSIFNVFATVILFPFHKQLEKLAYVIIRDEKVEEEKQQLLDERFLSTPSVALNRAEELTNEMALLARDAMVKAISLISSYDEKIAAEVIEAENTIDLYEDKLGTYLVKLSAKSLSTNDSHTISKLLHSIGDFERIGDHALNIYDAAEEIFRKKIVFTEDADAELSVISDAVSEIMTLAVDSFVNNDTTASAHIEPLEEVIDDLKVKLKANHIKRLQEGRCTIETGFVFSDMLTNFERVSDHCSNIAVCVSEVSHDAFNQHMYINSLKKYNNTDFETEYKSYTEKYKLV